MKINLNDDWLFFLQDKSKLYEITTKDLWARDYDDSEWKKICVPYDWAVTYPFDIKNSSGTGYLKGGTGWFRKHFKYDYKEGQSVVLNFDGVYKRCKVWMNGHYLGNWQNGWTSFGFNVTEALKKDGTENVLVVQVNHEDIADCRWYTGSGIMRPVWLDVKEGKVYFETNSVKFVSVENRFSVDYEIAAEDEDLINENSISCKVTVCDKDGKVVFEGAQDYLESPVEGKIENLNKWSPEDPYLYTLKAELLDGNKVTDSYETRVGFRDIKFDPNTGFTCNGKSYKFKGVCVHEDAGCFGNAVPKDVWKRRLLKLMETGCNAIRMSHNPHCDELYQLCDELGLFVMDEVYDEWENPKNKWWQGHNVYPPSHQGVTDDFISCYKQDVKAFVNRRYNHACVILWSIGNEIDYPNDPYCSPKFKEMTGNNDASKPAAERQFNPNHPDIGQINRIGKMLVKEVKKNDLSRPVTMALAFPELSADTGIIEHLDVVGYNYKEQFYADDHKRYADKPFVGSENSHTVEAWLAVKNNEYISGQFLWTGIDYLGEAKGWPIHGSPAGLITMAGFEKPMFWFRKGLWSNEKFVKIYTSVKGKEDWVESWNYESNSEIDVKVFTNCSSIEFSVNGKVSSYKKENVEEPFIQFTVKYEAGKAEAKADGCCDEIKTCGKAVAMKVSESGTELRQIEVKLVDAEGNFVADADSMVYANVENGRLIGLENGDLADVTEYMANYRHAHNGKLIVYATKNAKVTLSAKGMNDIVM